MLTRTMCGDEVSLLGFGCMRLPQKDGKIDRAAATALVDKAVAAGVNYFDTAFVYHGGESEMFLKEGLVARHPRESFYIATKLPMWQVDTLDTCKKTLETQLERTGAGYIDYYLMHGIGTDGWELAKKLGLPQWYRELQQQGVIRHRCFSFHGGPEELETILSEYDWDFVQMQINYYDWKFSHGEEMMDIAERHGVPVVVMEPVRGGGLVNMHEDVRNILAAADPSRSVASWGMRYAMELSGVGTVLSGMTTMEQLEDNLKTFSDGTPLTAAERAAIDKAVDAFAGVPTTGCTACNYCAPECPQHIEISKALGAMDEYYRFGQKDALYWGYVKEAPEDRLASTCIQCGACEAVCPQHLHIPDLLEEVMAAAGKGG